jgi:hypothetical protein
MKNNFLECISLGKEIIINVTNGSGTIAKAKNVFTGGIDSDFVNYGTDVKSQPTEKTPVKVFEMRRDATFAQIYNDFGKNIDDLCLTQPQIISFVTEHSKWLNMDGYATFFIFMLNNEFFIAHVILDDNGLEVCIYYYLKNDYIWGSKFKHRFVVPQLIE